MGLCQEGGSNHFGGNGEVAALGFRQIEDESDGGFPQKTGDLSRHSWAQRMPLSLPATPLLAQLSVPTQESADPLR